MMTRFSASAWSTALIDFSRDTDSGTMMNGKMTRSFNGSTGRTSGILIASSFADSFASVISASCPRESPHELTCNACSDEVTGHLSLQLVQLLHKRFDIFEIAIHRCESNISDRIEIAQ